MNITQFAAYAGVSKSAVSRYFNNGYLSPEKRSLIEASVQETGYSPSILAGSVKTKVTKLVGVILPKLSSESTARVVEGISSVLSEEGYELLLVNTDNNHKKEIYYLDLFRQNRVDGIILLASVFTPLHKQVLGKTKIPVIIVGQEYKGFPSVCHDDFGAAYAVTKYLIEQGAKKVVYIGANEADYAVGYERKRGYLKALSDFQLPFREELYTVSSFSMEAGYKGASRLLKKEKPDAVFCATDTIACGVYQYYRENLSCFSSPIRIAGIGDSKLSKILSLTSVHLHFFSAGAEAAKILLSSLKQKNGPPKSIRLDFELIPRS